MVDRGKYCAAFFDVPNGSGGGGSVLTTVTQYFIVTFGSTPLCNIHVHTDEYHCLHQSFQTCDFRGNHEP